MNSNQYSECINYYHYDGQRNSGIYVLPMYTDVRAHIDLRVDRSKMIPLGLGADPRSNRPAHTLAELATVGVESVADLRDIDPGWGARGSSGGRAKTWICARPREHRQSVLTKSACSVRCRRQVMRGRMRPGRHFEPRPAHGNRITVSSRR